jgi:hypothetical protein
MPPAVLIRISSRDRNVPLPTLSIHIIPAKYGCIRSPASNIDKITGLIEKSKNLINMAGQLTSTTGFPKNIKNHLNFMITPKLAKKKTPYSNIRAKICQETLNFKIN